METIASATDPCYRRTVWIGAVLGLCWSEVAGLRVKALDFFARSITIAKGGTVIRDHKGRPLTSDPEHSQPIHPAYTNRSEENLG